MGERFEDGFGGMVAVVTGGGTGMGRELVRQLTADGCDVAIGDSTVTGFSHSPTGSNTTLTYATHAYGIAGDGLPWSNAKFNALRARYSSTDTTDSTSPSARCGCIGRLTTSSAAATVAGRPPGAMGSRPAYAGWRCAGTG